MTSTLSKAVIWLLVALMSVPWPVPLAGQDAKPTFKPEEIEQMVAPIALFPDSLVSQILMASTYPLEVVQADRWVKQNKNLKGDALAAALEKQSWDPSVKSLVNFPQVLSTMSEKLDQTQKLGDAFLAQQKDVLDAVQRLRAKAKAEGHLETSKEQKVTTEQEGNTTVIKIEPADPQVVYVPTYNPTIVYGAWAYPAYPPYYWYPPGYVAFSFAAGVALGVAWGYAWGGCNWGRGDVDIDINRNTNINNTRIDRDKYKQQFQERGQRDRGEWKHDPSHRQGVSYRDNATAQKFNRGTDAPAAKSREAYRGRAEGGRQELAGDRGAVGGREGGPGDRGAGDKGAPGDRGGERPGGSVGDRSGGHRDAAAFEGMGRGGDTRSASARGSASRGGGSRAGAGGGARGGGGRGGGRR